MLIIQHQLDKQYVLYIRNVLEVKYINLSVQVALQYGDTIMIGVLNYSVSNNKLTEWGIDND